MYHVIRYDVKGMEKGRYFEVSYNGKKPLPDTSYEPPEILHTYTTVEEAEARIAELNEQEKESGEKFTGTLANDGFYDGPRFIYRMGVDPT